MVKEPKLVTNSNIKIKQVKVLKIERQNNDHEMFHSSPCKKENPKNSKLFFINGKSNSIQTDPLYPIFQHDMNMESRVWSKSQLSAMLMNIVAIYVYIVHMTTITTTM